MPKIVLEKDIEKKFCNWVECQGGKTWKWTGGRKKLDRIVLTHTGVLGLLEIKKPGGKLRSGQEELLEEIHKVNTRVAAVFDNFDDCVWWYKRLAKTGTELQRAVSVMADSCGSCPHDIFDWDHPNGCANECTTTDTVLSCWGKYFKGQ